MLRTMFVAILASAFFGPTYADKFDDVRQEAERAFQDLDREVAELEAQRQAEFKVYVQQELVRLQMDFIQSGRDSTLTARLMGMVSTFADSAIINTAASAQYKSVAFAVLIRNTRDRFFPGEDQKAGATSSVSSAEGSTVSGDVIGEEEVASPPSPSAHFTLEQVFQARDGSNWSENIRDATIPAKKRGLRKLFFWQKSQPTWPAKVGQVWASADGKVTFAVARGQSRLPQLARDQAELWARVLLAGGGQPGVTVASLAGTQAVQWEHRGDNVYCLMAVPTALLPKEVAR